jgi:hypothetical protein
MRKRNPEDGVVQDGGGKMNEKMQAKGASKGTKHGVSARRDAGCPFRRLDWGNQSPTIRNTQLKLTNNIFEFQKKKEYIHQSTTCIGM